MLRSDNYFYQYKGYTFNSEILNLRLAEQDE